MPDSESPLAIVHSAAPIRICDNGCWTDTWFAGHGQVFSVAVNPGAEVRVVVRAARDDAPPLIINALNFGERYEPPATRLPGALTLSSRPPSLRWRCHPSSDLKSPSNRTLRRGFRKDPRFADHLRRTGHPDVPGDSPDPTSAPG